MSIRRLIYSVSVCVQTLRRQHVGPYAKTTHASSCACTDDTVVDKCCATRLAGAVAKYSIDESAVLMSNDSKNNSNFIKGWLYANSRQKYSYSRPIV